MCHSLDPACAGRTMVPISSLPNFLSNPPVSKARMEVANLTERKNPHPSVYGVKEFVCLSVTKFDPNYLRTTKQIEVRGIHALLQGFNQTLSIYNCV